MAELNEALIEDIRRRANIVEVIRSYIQVIPAGRNYKAVCPFHDDHSPSMSISTDKQIYKCFACGNGGNVYTFVQNYEQVTFKQAVKRVCEISNIDVDFDVGEATIEVSEEKKVLYKILNETINFCKFQLHTEKGMEVVKYLHERGLDDEVIEYFEIGYNPADNALYKFLSMKGYSDEDILRAGVARLQNNGIVDVFDDRIMFPIHDSNGNPIAFSARNFSKEDRAKYINSGQNELYTKANVLYNAHRFKKLNRKYQEIYVVEGPLDVIALHRANFPNCVATMGTAFTKEQAMGLMRLAKTINLCYDGDDAGQNANFKAGVILKSIGASFQVIQNKTKLDPDEIIKQLGKNELQYMLEMPLTWIQYLFNFNLTKFNLENYSEKKEFAQVMVKEIQTINDEFDRETYFNRLCQLTSFPIDQLKKLISKSEPIAVNTGIRRRRKDYTKAELCEMQIVAQMLYSKEATNLFEEKLGFLNLEPMKSLSLHLISYYRNHDSAEISDLLTEISEEAERNLLFELEENELFSKEFNEELLQDAFNEIINGDIDLRIAALKKEAAMVSDVIRKSDIYQEIIDLKTRRKGVN
ncbi:MAG: DNA primase [Erysipelotrichales bacterium]|nr:DNA primase [Erysipelotrichales bacterium]